MTPKNTNPQRLGTAEGSRNTSVGDSAQCIQGGGLARLVAALERGGFEPIESRGLARCPAHDDRRPSLGFRQGQVGALIVCRSAGCSTESIVAALGLELAQLFDDWRPKGSRPRPPLRLAPPAPAPEQESEPLLEIPEHELWRRGEIVTYVNREGKTRDCVAAGVHTYRKPGGRAHHCVIRCEPPNARKWFLPLLWDGRVWRAGAQPRPATLYRLELLAVPGLKQIVLVEGEKAADALNGRDIAGLLSMTWPSGSGNVDKADFTPLTDRNVVLWPDADDAGRKAMTKLATILGPIAASLKMIRTDDLPKGHDAADVDPDEDVLAFLRGRVQGVVR